MKKKKIFIIIILLIQMIQFFINIQPTKAKINEGDEILLLGDHECDSVVEFFMEEYGYWTYKVVYYVYYNDEGIRYPAFCVEPAKLGVGTGYESYNAIINKVENVYENGEERQNQIWRILNKGYMGSSYTDWNLECDDDFYSATKIALHSLAQGISPVDKYVLGNTGVDGNPVEIVQRRGEKVLEVAQSLYEYGLYGSENYEKPEISIEAEDKASTECINSVEYYIQSYIINSNKELKSYDVSIKDFPDGTIILNSDNKEVESLESNLFKIAIPVSEIQDDINGKIFIENAKVKTKPIFYCKSLEEGAQSYVTFNNEYEITNANIDLSINANTAQLLIKKVDKDDNNPLSDVVFEILDQEKNKILESKTEDNGEILLENLKPQTIYVREVKQKDGYVLNKDLIEVKLQYGKTSEVNFTNSKQKGKIKITKVDKEDPNIKLKGVEFEILDEKGNVLEKVITNEDGIAYSKDYSIIDYNKLKIKEVKTIDNYILNEEIVEVQLKENETQKIIFENEKEKEPEIEVPKLPRTGF